MEIVSKICERSFSTSIGFKRSISLFERIGLSITGPIFLTISKSMPIDATGFIISEYKIAASTPSLRTGISVISAASSG
ncbi:hypothetical protein D3C76_1218810 [compost metagenome]